MTLPNWPDLVTPEMEERPYHHVNPDAYGEEPGPTINLRMALTVAAIGGTFSFTVAYIGWHIARAVWS